MDQDGFFQTLFQPSSIAVIGATEKAGSVGRKVWRNLIRSQFPGKLYPVNPKHKQVFGEPCFSSVIDIEQPIDLAVITTPAATVEKIIQECGKKNIHSAIIISAGFSEMGAEGKIAELAILAAANQANMRFIGPNCLGVMRPSAHVNATFDNNQAEPGDIALLSQSGAVCAAILDWAVERNIDFSTIVSMGNSVDLDFGDVLEYLAHDPATKSILLYIEGVHYPRRFLEGLHAASRMKPVIALKAGRHASGVRAVHSHTGALVGDDDVFTAALNRGGAVRVNSIEQLFTAAEVLASTHRTEGNRLSIVTNGGGAGVMAADRAADLGIELPEPSAALLDELNKKLPAAWSHQNPFDLLGDATPDRYQQVISACLKDEASDGLLAILVPVAMSAPAEVAKAVCDLSSQTKKPLITCWMGERQTKAARHLFETSHIPCYSTPEVAVEAFSYLAAYQHSQQLLTQSVVADVPVRSYDLSAVKTMLHDVGLQKRNTLTMQESKALLRAFGVPVTPVIECATVMEAQLAAESLVYPVAMKIQSPEISHKQDVGGVILNIGSGQAVKQAFDQMMKDVKERAPTATIQGVTIEPMYNNANYREVMIGMLSDKVFGPVITFGLGGSLVEVIHDRSVQLPPLNPFLITQMIAQTEAAKYLAEFRGKPPVKIEALIDILLRISDMVRELPMIQEMDINPLLIDERGAVVVDARFVVDTVVVPQAEYGHMAIHPLAPMI